MGQRFKSTVRYFLPRRIQRHRILAGSLQGCQIVTSWHDYPAAITGRTERSLLDWLTTNVKLGETWLDIGAHYGYTAIALCRLVGDQGRVFAFEPMISTAGYLNQTKILNKFHKMTVLPFALGDRTEINIGRLSVVRGMGDSTLNGKKHETIFLTSLDWLWPQVCGQDRSIDGVKIDVQGMELEIIKGMGEVLKSNKPKLVIEFHKGVDRNMMLNTLVNIGYTRPAVPIEPVSGENMPQFLDDKSYAFELK
ncbi:MAG: FkbM family methyltransferase [Anaerolineales bacterium]